MKTRRRILLAVLAATLMLSAAVPAAAADPEYLTTLPEATRQTTLANIAHYQSVTATAADDNDSCRLEQPVFVVQPEIDHRVTVKGEDTAVTEVTCVNLMLVDGPGLKVHMFLQYWDGDSWEPILDEHGRAITSDCQLPRVRGAGTLPCPIDAVLYANHPATGKLHRVGATLLSPKVWEPIYTENPLGITADTIALTDPCRQMINC